MLFRNLGDFKKSISEFPMMPPKRAEDEHGGIAALRDAGQRDYRLGL